MKDGDLHAGIEYPLFTEQAKPYSDKYEKGLREVRNLFIAPLGLALPLEVKANITIGRTMDSIIPYGRGYQFDARDMNWATRTDKILSLPRSDFLLQDFHDNPYVLELYADEHTLGELGFSRQIPYRSKYSNEKIMMWHLKNPVRKALERLRVQVTFPGEFPNDQQEEYHPGGVYQVAPDDFCLSSAYMLMHKFYPSEMGPLPLRSEYEQDLADKISEKFGSGKDEAEINADDITFWEGLNLRLPKSSKRLAAAHMKFRLITVEESRFESITR